VGRREPPFAGLAARDGADDSHFGVVAKRLFEQTSPSNVDAVDVHVDETAQLAGFVEDEISHGELAERLADGPRADLEPFLPTRLGGEDRREVNDSHAQDSAASTERIGGRSRAASIHSAPPCGDVHTEPPCVPK
jgi:hypothetical protein